MIRSQLNFFGIKFNPFDPGLPQTALYVNAGTSAFCRRVQGSLHDGGFAMVTGEPGCGKSVALRILAHELSTQRDVMVATIDHPQSRPADFYRELGDRLAPGSRVRVHEGVAGSGEGCRAAHGPTSPSQSRIAPHWSRKASASPASEIVTTPSSGPTPARPAGRHAERRPQAKPTATAYPIRRRPRRPATRRRCGDWRASGCGWPGSRTCRAQT